LFTVNEARYFNIIVTSISILNSTTMLFLLQLESKYPTATTTAAS
jgi:hypothetical protein